MSGSVGGLASIFWENSEIVDKLQSFQDVGHFFFHEQYAFSQSVLSETQTLFVPLVEKLGYVYDDQESSDTTLLRTLAITQAAAAADDGYCTHLNTSVDSHLLALVQSDNRTSKPISTVSGLRKCVRNPCRAPADHICHGMLCTHVYVQRSMLINY